MFYNTMTTEVSDDKFDDTFSLKRFKPDSESSESEEAEEIKWDKWIGGFAFDYEFYHIHGSQPKEINDILLGSTQEETDQHTETNLK